MNVQWLTFLYTGRLNETHGPLLVRGEHFGICKLDRRTHAHDLGTSLKKVHFSYGLLSTLFVYVSFRQSHWNFNSTIIFVYRCWAHNCPWRSWVSKWIIIITIRSREKTNYTIYNCRIHNQAVNNVHQEFANKCGLLKEISTPYCKYEPQSELGNSCCTLYQGRSFTSDRTVHNYRSNIFMLNKPSEKHIHVYVAALNSHNH